MTTTYARKTHLTTPEKCIRDVCFRCGGSGRYGSFGECYRCGGNGKDPKHLLYAYPSSWSDEQCQEWESQRLARNEARRRAAAEKREAEANRAWNANLAACPALAAAHEFCEYQITDDYGDTVPRDQWPVIVRHASQWESRFLRDIASKARRFALSEGQIKTLDSIVAKVAERAEQAAAEEATLVDPPAGRCEIEGEVISVKVQDGRFGRQVKLLVKCDGFKAYGTCPASLDDVERGVRVRLTATVQPKERGFAFWSRPTKASIVTAVESV